ncbi:hypothetical protein G3480_22670 [Thiorhodococcus mannitoliphagus]|uniref:Uncharacterized protein n=1 Tax=Thiorhodococcus mannitoliphagus TaxID=329406 RepID=A0A6P1E1X1_9GAMM|nr:hypothetical protein [Thiorhodococcus mannitoliphagus]NEX23066.1 hypothetical protein [Thiorhodococcus mannitoliphagus]
MLSINDLPLRHDLDAATMSNVRGGFALSDFDAFFGTAIVNAPEIDLGTHALLQSQGVAVDQSSNIGGLNLVISDQTQNGIAGQVAI